MKNHQTIEHRMPMNKKRNTKITLIRKVNAIENWMGTGNIKATARVYDLQTSHLRKRRINYPKMKELALKSPKKYTIHPG